MDDDPRACSLAEVVDQHYAMLYRYAYRLTGSAADAEDLTQQAFLTAQTKIDQLREPEHAKAWLFSILRNAYLKERRDRGTPFVSLDHVAEPADEPPVDPRFDQHELQAVLDELPEEFRTALILFYFNELSYKEIARHLDVPIGTVMSRLARGKSHLRHRLAACETASAGMDVRREP